MFYNKNLLNKGDLIMPKDDIGGGLIIGKTAYIDQNNKYILGDHVFCLKSKNINSLYLHYLINSSYIKVKLDDNEPVLLSSLTNGIIGSDIRLNPGESITMSIRIWLDINTPNTEIGKSFSAKIVTDGVGSEYV